MTAGVSWLQSAHITQKTTTDEHPCFSGILSVVLLLFSHFVIFLTCFFFFTVQHNTNIHAAGGIGTRNPSKQAAADPRLRPLGHLRSTCNYLLIVTKLRYLYHCFVKKEVYCMMGFYYLFCTKCELWCTAHFNYRSGWRPLMWRNQFREVESSPFLLSDWLHNFLKECYERYNVVSGLLYFHTYKTV